VLVNHGRCANGHKLAPHGFYRRAAPELHKTRYYLTPGTDAGILEDPLGFLARVTTLRAQVQPVIAEVLDKGIGNWRPKNGFGRRSRRGHGHASRLFILAAQVLSEVNDAGPERPHEKTGSDQYGDGYPAMRLTSEKRNSRSYCAGKTDNGGCRYVNAADQEPAPATSTVDVISFVHQQQRSGSAAKQRHRKQADRDPEEYWRTRCRCLGSLIHRSPEQRLPANGQV
jgi:hypothetical protein